MDMKGRSFLVLLKKNMRSGVYWQMIGESYCKFGNDFARGLEYLRHYGFCQVSTNPVLAARAFDEDATLTDELRDEIDKHDVRGQGGEQFRVERIVRGDLLGVLRPDRTLRYLDVLVALLFEVLLVLLGRLLGDGAVDPLEQPMADDGRNFGLRRRGDDVLGP